MLNKSGKLVISLQQAVGVAASQAQPLLLTAFPTSCSSPGSSSPHVLSSIPHPGFLFLQDALFLGDYKWQAAISLICQGQKSNLEQVPLADFELTQHLAIFMDLPHS